MATTHLNKIAIPTPTVTANSTSTVNTGGGLISFGTTRDSDTPGTYPGHSPYSPVNRFDAGTFVYEPRLMPESSGLANMACPLLALSLGGLILAFKKKKGLRASA